LHRYATIVILIVDNYDSFTYNLVQTIGALPGKRTMAVVRNDAATVDQLVARCPEHIIISPGPGAPDAAGISVELVRRVAGQVPILGVCLGHQCIAQAFGGRVLQALRLMHGKTSMIEHNGRSIYKGLSQPFAATRYHSLTVERHSLPDVFEICAVTSDYNELMGIRHKTMPLEGVQFHPESFLTAEGPRLIANFLSM
jgi:anthranilate synthase/aminodeoxychorismate synthase-like glutamine amidotransferase